MAIKIKTSSGIQTLGGIAPPPSPPVVEPVIVNPISPQPEPVQSIAPPTLMEALSKGVPEAEAKITATVEVHPWDIDETYTILNALDDYTKNKFPGQTLKLVHRHTVGCTYVVKAYESATGRAQLEGGFKGGLLKPVITEREVPIYYPVWS
jgi:hypothetical protein